MREEGERGEKGKVRRVLGTRVGRATATSGRGTSTGGGRRGRSVKKGDQRAGEHVRVKTRGEKVSRQHTAFMFSSEKARSAISWPVKNDLQEDRHT